MFDRIIIGGGAAGLFCAATSRKLNKGLILEKGKAPGSKLLMSGSGQCNITHGGKIQDFINHYGDGGKKIRKLLYGANNVAYCQFIEGLGVPVFEREDGKIFPVSLKASDIRDVLESKARANGYEIRCNTAVSDILPLAEGYQVITEKGQVFRCRQLVLACGGRSYPGTGSDGSIIGILEGLDIGIEAQAPALAPIYVQDYKYAGLSGISFKDVHVSLEGHENIGDLLLTHKNFSGPAIINISRYAKAGQVMTVNFLHPARTDEIAGRIKKEAQGSNKAIANIISESLGLAHKFVEAILDEASIDKKTPGSQLRKSDALHIAKLLCQHQYNVSGTGGYNEAMVTRGGVKLEEINLSTMESIKYPGLFIIGELLDIDGDTGGYNLQFAYSSAVAVNR